MSFRLCVILFAVLIGLASAARLKQTVKGECVDNTLYAKFVCEGKEDGEKILVPGSCSEYYLCSNGVSEKKSCLRFFDPESKKCVLKSECVEVDNTDCVIPTPPPCGATPSTPTPCECPDVPTPTTPSCPIVTCPTPTCPAPTTCPEPVECPAPPTCPPTEPSTKPPTEPPTKPPTEPPTEPPTKPPTEPPTEPPTKPPTEPPTEPPTQPPNTPCPSPGPGPCNSYYNPDDLYGTYACRNKADGTMLIVPSNCSQYLYCIGGWSYLKSCGSNMYYNSLVGACDEKSNVYCPSG